MIWVFICVHMRECVCVCVRVRSPVDGWVGCTFISWEVLLPPWFFMTFGLIFINDSGFCQLPEKGCSH